VTALILGVSGQDGYYLAEQLLDAGQTVFGAVRRPAAWPLGARLLTADLLDQSSLEAALRISRPDVVYNLAAVTAPGGAWGTQPPPLLADVTALGPVRLLDAVLKVCPDTRVVHASSSAIYDPHRYGLYGVSKLFAHQAVQGYRTRGLHCSNAVLYSHTSPRQDRRFLAPTICATLARIRAGSTERLRLTDVLGRRDWGYAPDFMRALPLIADHDQPGDYVVATGRRHTVRDFADAALAAAGLTWHAVEVDQGPVAPVERPADLSMVETLGWKPGTGFAAMVRLMMEAAWT
jgi:GDPmannose 4,6-dehydratase